MSFFMPSNIFGLSVSSNLIEGVWISFSFAVFLAEFNLTESSYTVFYFGRDLKEGIFGRDARVVFTSVKTLLLSKYKASPRDDSGAIVGSFEF